MMKTTTESGMPVHRVMAGLIALLAGMILVALGVGVVLRAQPIAPTGAARAIQAPPAAAPPAAPPLGAIGSRGQLRPSPNGWSWIWVEQTGLWAWNRAYGDRDDKGLERVHRVFEAVEVPNGTPITVTAIARDAVQVEVETGPLAGRRGWTAAADLVRR